MGEWLLPFSYQYMINAIGTGTVVGVVCGVMSCFLVQKGWSLMGDAVSHAVLPGVVIAYIINIPYIIGAFFAGMICAVATGFLKDNSRIKQVTVMGVVFSGMFGFGIVLYTKIQSDVHLDHILFGNMLGVGLNDIATTSIIAAIVTGAIAFRWRDLVLHSFDPGQAKVAGLPVRLIHYGLLIILSLTIVSALKAVGIILTIALLIAPGAIVFLVTRRFENMMFMAVAASVFSTFFGVYLSFFIDSAPAPTIVLLMTGLFLIAFLVTTLSAAKTTRSAN